MSSAEESPFTAERPDGPIGSAQEHVRALIDEYRSRCLWFLKPDYYPSTVDELNRVLAYVERYGDRAAHMKVGERREWLSRHSSATSADS